MGGCKGNHPTPCNQLIAVIYGHDDDILVGDSINHVYIGVGGWWGNHPSPCNQLIAVIYGHGNNILVKVNLTGWWGGYPNYPNYPNYPYYPC